MPCQKTLRLALKNISPLSLQVGASGWPWGWGTAACGDTPGGHHPDRARAGGRLAWGCTRFWGMGGQGSEGRARRCYRVWMLKKIWEGKFTLDYLKRRLGLIVEIKQMGEIKKTMRDWVWIAEEEEHFNLESKKIEWIRESEWMSDLLIFSFIVALCLGSMKEYFFPPFSIC